MSVNRRVGAAVVALLGLLAALVAVPLSAQAVSAPGIFANDVSLARPTSGTSSVSMVVQLTNPAQVPVTVAYATADGSALSVNDYAQTSGTLKFPVGSTSQALTVTVNGTSQSVGDKYFQVSFFGPQNGVLTRNVAYITLQDVTTPPYLSVRDAVTHQGNGVATTASFLLSLSSPAVDPVSVRYAASDGSARANIDYTPTSGTVTIPVGSSSATVTVPVTATSQFSAYRYFYLTISKPHNVIVANSQATATILFDGTPAYLTLDDTAVVRPASGSTVLNMPIRLTKAVAYPVTVSYYTSDNSATVAAGDYLATTGTVTIPAGTTTATAPVTIVGGSTAAPSKSFYFQLFSPTAGAVIMRSGLIIILRSPTVGYLSVNDTTVTRSVAGTVQATFTVTMQPSRASAVTVAYATSDGTAVAPAQYTATSGSLTFAAGQTSKTVTVPVVANTTVFTSTYFFFNLGAVTGLGQVFRSQGASYINPSTIPSRISPLGSPLVRPVSGTGTVPFVVSLSEASVNTVNVNYLTSDGSAVSGTDYTAVSGTLTFAPGQTSKTVNVSIVGNQLPIPSRYFYLNLNTPVNAVLTSTSVVSYIESRTKAPSFTIDSTAVYEGNNGSVTATGTVRLTYASPVATSVNYFTSDGSAIAGGDYTAVSGTLAFPAGTTSKTFSVTVAANTLPQANRYFYINMNTPVNATIGNNNATVTIYDDDYRPYVSLAGTAVVRGAAATNAVVTATLSTPSPNTVTVNYSTSDGSAVNGRDYTATSGTITFNPNQTSKTVSVPVAAGTVRTGDRYFYVSLSAAVNATVSAQSYSQVFISDPSSLSQLSVNDVAQLRQTSGSANAVFTVTLTPASLNPVTVNYSNSDGSAVNGVDYTARSGSLTFAAGVTSQTVSVPILPKAARGNDLYFYLSISSAVNATVQRSSAIAELINNVAPLTSPSYLTIADTSLNRPTAAASNVTFTMTLKPAPTTTVTALYYTGDGSAIAGIDYTSVIGTVTFAAGQTSKTVTVPVLPSTAYQADKYFSLSVTNFTGPGVAMRNPAYATIVNHTALPRLNVGGDVSSLKPNTGTFKVTFPVTLSVAQAFPVSVDYATADGSALAPGSYNPAFGTLTIPAGQTSGSIQVTINSNLLILPTQYFSLSLADASGAAISTATAYAYIVNQDLFTMTGKVTNTNGVGTAGVTVTRTGNSQPTVTATTAADGSYSFVNSIDGTYVITPTLAATTYLPLTQSVTVRGQNAGVGPFIGYTGKGLTGQITNSSGAKLAGVTVTRTGGGGGTVVVTTNSLGNYAFGAVATGTGYVITPTLAGYSFVPASLTTAMASATVNGLGFIGVQPAYITGRVVKAGAGVGGVTLTLNGGAITPITVTTNAQGYYGFSTVPVVAALTNYTVTPTLSGGTFTPASAGASVSTTVNATGVNFTQN